MVCGTCGQGVDTPACHGGGGSCGVGYACGCSAENTGGLILTSLDLSLGTGSKLVEESGWDDPPTS
jgi:hypothetical protein